MLLKWRLSGFKSIGEPIELELAPITVITGLNSSGKSSILQSIRLVSQTLRNQSKERALIPNGYEIQLGSFDSVINDKFSNRPMSIGFTGRFAVSIDSRSEPGQLRTHSETSPAISMTLSSLVGFERTRESTAAGLGVGQVKVAGGSFELEGDAPFETLLDVPQASQDELKEETTYCTLAIAELSEDEIKQILEKTSKSSPTHLFRPKPKTFAASIEKHHPAAPTNARLFTVLDHFLPSFFYRPYSVRERQIDQTRTYLLLSLYYDESDDFDPEVLLREITEAEVHAISISEQTVRGINDLLYKVDGNPQMERGQGQTLGDVLTILRSITKNGPEQSMRNQNMREIANLLLVDVSKGIDDRDLNGFEFVYNDGAVEALEKTLESAKSFFVRGIRYIGPIRLEPSASPSFSPSSEDDDVGARGEYAAVVFHSSRDRILNWWNPFTERAEFGTLEKATSTWLKYLDVAEAIWVEENPASGMTWTVRLGVGERPRSLSSVGVGVSQVLPIIVGGLLAPSGTLFLVEQPELHLHPRAQARLAEFFWGLSKVGKRGLIETHSDAFVSHLRLIIARRGEPENSQVSIYFSARNEEGDSHFEKVEFSESGTIVNWPDGFLDEALILEDRISAAAMQRRMQTK